MTLLRNFISKNLFKTGNNQWHNINIIRKRNYAITTYAKLNKRFFSASLHDKMSADGTNSSQERMSEKTMKTEENVKGKKTEAYNSNDSNEQTGQNKKKEEKHTVENITEETEIEEANYEKLNKADLIKEIKKTKKVVNEKSLDNKILKEKYLSVLAENENLRNRYLKEIENNKIYCITNFAKSLLDVADNLSLAIQNINEESLKKNEEINNIHKGIQMTETILHNIFNNYGINKYNPINEKFDPLFHEAIYEINDDTKERGTVATVIQHGYKIKDRILRAAKVGVVKN